MPEKSDRLVVIHNAGEMSSIKVDGCEVVGLDVLQNAKTGKIGSVEIRDSAIHATADEAVASVLSELEALKGQLSTEEVATVEEARASLGSGDKGRIAKALEWLLPIAQKTVSEASVALVREALRSFGVPPV